MRCILSGFPVGPVKSLQAEESASDGQLPSLGGLLLYHETPRLVVDKVVGSLVNAPVLTYKP